MTLLPDHLVFIDVEASSIGPDSWPIEVGLAWIDDGQVHSWSSLIRPAPVWDLTSWSGESAAIHGITLEELQDAPAADSVADEVVDRIEHKHVFSDAPGMDHFWCEQLLDTIGLIPPRFASAEMAIGAACDDDRERIKDVNVRLQAMPRPHRAGQDAERLATAVLLGMQLSE